MNRFAYTARDAQGALQRGAQDALDAGQVAAQLIGRGWVPVRIEPQRGGSTGATADATRAGSAGSKEAGQGLRWRQRAPSTESVTLALRELAAMLKAGIPIMRSLRLVSDTCDSPMLRQTFDQLIADLDAGRSLAAAMERRSGPQGPFRAYDVAMVRVGEETGRLAESLLELHRQREFMRATREQVAGALRYPAFVVLTCVAAVIVLNLFVIPAFAQVFASMKAELPLLTRILLGTSRAMQAGWPVALVAAVAGAWGWRRWTSTPEGRRAWDRTLLRLPLVGRVLDRIVMARVATSLAGCLSAGLTVPQSLRVTAATLDNAHVGAAIERVVAGVERGEALSSAARGVGVFPSPLLQMIAIGEESGSLPELLDEIGRHYHHEVELAVRKLSASLEPILIGLLGLGVGVLALGVFLPMWELGRAATR